MMLQIVKIAKSYIFVIPFVNQIGLACQEVHIPVQGLKMPNEGVIYMTRGALLVERGPVLVVKTEIFVEKIIKKFFESGINEL